MARAALLSLPALGAASFAGDLQAGLQAAADATAAKYKCKVSVAYHDSKQSLSAGSGMDADTSMIWGSVTKMLTGASTLKLASEGQFGLDDPASPHVDPVLAALSLPSMEKLWGADAAKVTFRELLHMTSGIADFDTANPRPPFDDSLRAELVAHPTHYYTPDELIQLPWVATGEIRPARSFDYSSTNFMLLGYMLAGKTVKSWKDFDQGSFLPDSLKQRIKFATTGAPKDYTSVVGYDQTQYNNNTGSIDMSGVDGVFGGWTASDITGDAAAMAELTYQIHSAGGIAPKEYAKMMQPEGSEIYGLAAHGLSSRTGYPGESGVAYGHLGATYGYQSIVSYHPAIDATITVATNIETDNQQQPAMALCLAHNAAANLINNQNYTCTFTPGSYYSGGCKCNVPLPPCTCSKDYPYCWSTGSGADHRCYKSETSSQSSRSTCHGTCTASYTPPALSA